MEKRGKEGGRIAEQTIQDNLLHGGTIASNCLKHSTDSRR